jgi:isoleucyl-tRNA synthetase
MLTSIATRGRAPYRRIITHGWTVDGEGKAMHKSLGNSVSPDEVINEYGADLLRLWVSSSDYTSDVRISKDILKQLSDIYLKIRNTARYILGNLDGFDPDDLVPFAEMDGLDRWAVSRLNALVGRVRESYDKYEYHTIYHGIHNFCAVEMSNFYLDVIKDRLYCDPKSSASGKSARTAIYLILDALVRLLAPILAFTSEEIWAAMPHHAGVQTGSVLWNDMPGYDPALDLTEEETEKWRALLELRAAVNKELEVARANKVIGKPLDAEIELPLTDAPEGFYPLDKLFIVSRVTAGGGAITVRASEAPKCARCWTHNEHVGENGEHPELCPRCVEAIK